MAIDSYKDSLLGSGWALCSLAILLVAARCYCRIVLLRRFDWDDGFMVFAMASGIVMVVLVTMSTVYGFGRHFNTITDPYDIQQVIKYTLIPAAVSIISSTAGKLSVVIFLMRLLGQSTTRIHRICLFGFTGLLVSLNVFAIIIILAKCVPLEKAWAPDTPGTCMAPQILSIGGRVQAIYTAIFDVLTAVFPAYMVHSLQLKKSTKWGLTFLMGGGIFAAAATIMKVYYMKEVDNFADLTYSWGPIATWYMAEVLVLIITGSVPTLKPLYNKMVKGAVPSGQSYGNGNGSKGRPGNNTYGSLGGDPTRSTASKFKKSAGFSGRRPGSVTIALDDIDDMQTKREADSSSVESILPKYQTPLPKLPSNGMNGSQQNSISASTPPRGIPNQSVQSPHDIRVDTQVSVTHGNTSNPSFDPYGFAR